MWVLIEQVNTESLGNIVIIESINVKALYKSIDIELPIKVVCEIFKRGGVSILSIDYKEFGLYIIWNRTSAEIQAVRLQRVCSTFSTNARSETCHNCERYGDEKRNAI